MGLLHQLPPCSTQLTRLMRSSCVRQVGKVQQLPHCQARHLARKSSTVANGMVISLLHGKAQQLMLTGSKAPRAMLLPHCRAREQYCPKAHCAHLKVLLSTNSASWTASVLPVPNLTWILPSLHGKGGA